MSLPLTALAAWAFGASAAPAASALVSVQLALRENVTVSGHGVTLGDLAQVSSEPASAGAALAALALGQAPHVGYTTELTRLQIEQLVRARTPALKRLDWSGANAVKLRAASQSLAAARMIDAGSAFLQGRLGPRFDSVSLEALGINQDIDVPLGAITLTARGADQPTPYRRIPVWIDIAIDGQPCRTMVVHYAVKAVRQVCVARRALGAGSAISSADCDAVAQDVAGPDPQPLPLAALDAPLRLRQALRLGDTLKSGQVASATTVLTGDQVALVLSQPGLVLETRARAEQDGKPGQLIKVTPERADHPVLARIVSANLVQAESN